MSNSIKTFDSFVSEAKKDSWFDKLNAGKADKKGKDKKSDPKAAKADKKADKKDDKKAAPKKGAGKDLPFAERMKAAREAKKTGKSKKKAVVAIKESRQELILEAKSQLVKLNETIAKLMKTPAVKKSK
jgi:hypothetical protein